MVTYRYFSVERRYRYRKMSLPLPRYYRIIFTASPRYCRIIFPIPARQLPRLPRYYCCSRYREFSDGTSATTLLQVLVTLRVKLNLRRSYYENLYSP